MSLPAAFRLVAGNLLVLIGLLLGLLFLMSLTGDVYNFAKTFFPKNDKRARLPSYQDHEYAQLIFSDQKGRIKSYAPFTEWRQTATHSTTLNIDENGHRMHTVGLENLPSAIELGFFGASTVWGTGVDDNNTIPAHFDQITDQYVVVNYSERGYTSMQNLIDLITLINQRRAPKVVIFYGLLNDIWVHCNESVTARLNSHLEERRMQNALDRTANENYLYNNIIEPIVDLTLQVSGGEKSQQIAACSGNSVRANNVAEMMVKNLEMANTLVTAYGGQFFAFLQPSAYWGNPRTDYLSLPHDSFIFQQNQMKAVLPLFLAKMNGVKRDWFSDLSGAFNGKDFILIDHVHSSPLGNSIMAEKIRNVLQEKTQATR